MGEEGFKMKYLKEILIIALVIWIASKYIFDTPETITETVIQRDTVTVEIQSKPIIKWKEREVFVEDSSTITELNGLIDSLQNEMNNHFNSTGQLGEYTANLDTTLTDSTGKDVGKISLSAVSRIPFDPELRFLIKGTWINTNTETTIIKGRTFWQRFGISAQVGAGMGLTTKVWDVYAGIGAHFEIL